MRSRIVAPFKFVLNKTLGSPILPAVTVILLAAAAVYFTSHAEPPSARAAFQKPKLVDAPELVGGVDWLNTDKPIKLADLRGRIVLLDFWTLC